MRRDAVDRAVQSVHWTTPRFFFRRCSICHDDVKKEQMWWFEGVGSRIYTGWYRTWTCRRCAPMMSDLFKAHPGVFVELDISCIEEEERQYHKYQEDKGAA